MNSMSSEKYQGLNVTLGEVVNNVANMNKTYEELLSKLALVDRLDKKVTGLEKMAYALDAYSKRLGEYSLFFLFALDLVSRQFC